MDTLAFESGPNMELLLRVKKGPTKAGSVASKETDPHKITYDGNCKHEYWDTWQEREDTTEYYVEVLADSTVKKASDMLSLVSGAFSVLGKLGKVVRVGGEIIDTASDIGTDTGLATLLGELFDEHKVLFTYELGIKTEYLQTAKEHHLRSYVKE